MHVSTQMNWRLPAMSARMGWRLPALEDICWRHPALTLSRGFSCCIQSKIRRLPALEDIGRHCWRLPAFSCHLLAALRIGRHSLSCVDCRHVVGGIPPLHYVVVFVLCSSLLLSIMISSMLFPSTMKQGQTCHIRLSAWIWRSLVSTCPGTSMLRV